MVQPSRVANDSPVTRSALGAPAFRGRRPTRSGDLAVETHGIAPIGEDQRYGKPARLFTVWFAPQVNMTGVFTGTLAITLGLGFWLGLVAMVIGTVLGSLVVGYLSTWGPRTGAAQLPNSRMAFGAAWCCRRLCSGCPRSPGTAWWACSAPTRSPSFSAFRSGSPY